MNSKKRAWIILFIFLATPLFCQEWLDRLDDRLWLGTSDGTFRVDLTTQFDLEGYYIDQLPPGLIYGDLDGDSFINPRLTFFLDARAGKSIYAFMQARIDRGFDPRAEVRSARFDEYAIRWTPLPEGQLNLQVGKFATVFGGFVKRHQSWDNAFITAPLPYEKVNTISDHTVAPNRAAFISRRDMPDKKELWVPIIWGPVYAAGASLFGAAGKIDYAVEIKNTSLSVHPEAADPFETGWENPTFTGRLGFRPTPAWNLGVSGSYGAYFWPEAAGTAQFPAGRDLGDYPQITLGGDVAYAWHHWEFWAEVMASRFEVPYTGAADTLSYYLEAKYKLSARWYLAARWNQQFYGTVQSPEGEQVAWDYDAWRADAAIGCRFTRHLQGKLQYSYNHQEGPIQQGEQFVAAQLTLKF